MSPALGRLQRTCYALFTETVVLLCDGILVRVACHNTTKLPLIAHQWLRSGPSTNGQLWLVCPDGRCGTSPPDTVVTVVLVSMPLRVRSAGLAPGFESSSGMDCRPCNGRSAGTACRVNPLIARTVERSGCDRKRRIVGLVSRHCERRS
jgi:hypothetical protein